MVQVVVKSEKPLTQPNLTVICCKSVQGCLEMIRSRFSSVYCGRAPYSGVKAVVRNLGDGLPKSSTCVGCATQIVNLGGKSPRSSIWVTGPPRSTIWVSWIFGCNTCIHAAAVCYVIATNSDVTSGLKMNLENSHIMFKHAAYTCLSLVVAPLSPR